MLPRGRPRQDRLRGSRADIGLALALSVLWQIELWAPDAVPAVSGVSQHRAALAVIGLAMMLPLAVRRTAPLASCAGVMAGAVLADAVGPSPEGVSEVAALMLSSFSVALYSESRRAWGGLALIALGVGLSQGFAPDDVSFGLLLFGAAW